MIVAFDLVGLLFVLFSDYSFRFLQKKVAKKLMMFTEQTRLGLQHRIAVHPTLDLSIQIDAPAILVPCTAGLIGVHLGKTIIRYEQSDVKIRKEITSRIGVLS